MAELARFAHDQQAVMEERASSALREVAKLQGELTAEQAHTNATNSHHVVIT